VFIIFYLTYTFDPISIKFIQPFLDDYNTGSTQVKERQVNFARNDGIVQRVTSKN
jgi:hypothetical protein